jgi:uronate dehydrogenase
MAWRRHRRDVSAEQVAAMKLLITGGAGRIGRKLRKEMADQAALIRTFDRIAAADLGPNEESIVGDLSDMPALEAAMQGIDGVIHLAAIPNEQAWEVMLQTNIIGTWNVYEAAFRAGVKRVVFGSSNHAVGFYPRGQRLDASVPCRPDSRYGLSKCWGEDVGSLYADKYGVKSLHIRIGNALGPPTSLRTMAIWISERDLAQLVMIGLTHPDVHNTIVYGVSDNAAGWYDNSAAHALGYRPLDRSEAHIESARAGDALQATDAVGRYYQGGLFCSIEYAGPPVPKT